MVEIINPTRPVKIRKAHRCFACNRKFEAGTVMYRQTNKMDGDIYSVYSCPACDQLMDKYPDHFMDESERCFPGGCVTEVIASEFEFHGSTPEEFLEYLNKNHEK